MASKEEHVAKLEAQIERWSERIDALMAKAQTATAEARISVQKELDECKPKLEAARQKVDELKAIGADKYEEAKATLESFWKEAKAVFERNQTIAPK